MARATRKSSSKLPQIDHLDAEELASLIKRAEQQLEKKRKEMRDRLLADMRAAAEKAGFDFDDLVGRGAAIDGRRKRSDVGVRLSAKYVGPNGETYKGRGPVPKWLKALERKGVSREKFRVKGA
jgi:DNA-binding protein H-NS